MSDNPRSQFRPPRPGPAGGEHGSARQASDGEVGPLLILDQAFDGDSLYALRAALAAHAAQAGLPEFRVYDLIAVVHELAANAVRHGGGRGQLLVWKADSALRCRVTDPGTSEASRETRAAEAGPERQPHAASPPERWDGEHGHGLWLARQLSDQLIIRSGPRGTVAEVSFAVDATRP
jgi:anti-sigma regulatory factor (Ser/Thr protein kinase)